MKLLTLARDLQRRKAREKHHRFVAEGVRTVETLLASAVPVTGVLVAAGVRDETRARAVLEMAEARRIPVVEVSDAELASAADTDTPQGVLAVASIPAPRLDAPGAVARYLVLDALQDPGNVGTVVRTAAALGVTATIALPGTVDFWNAKVVRGSMGALFHHPVVALTWEACAAFVAEHAVALVAADLSGVSIDTLDRAALPDRLALVVSNEGAGLSAPVAQSVGHRVAIPMPPEVESLNVAVATGILLYALRRPNPVGS